MAANLSLALLTSRKARAVRDGGQTERKETESSPVTPQEENGGLDRSYLIFPSVAPTVERKISRISSLTKQQLVEEVQGARRILERIHIGSNGGGSGSG